MYNAQESNQATQLADVLQLLARSGRADLLHAVAAPHLWPACSAKELERCLRRIGLQYAILELIALPLAKDEYVFLWEGSKTALEVTKHLFPPPCKLPDEFGLAPKVGWRISPLLDFLNLGYTFSESSWKHLIEMWLTNVAEYLGNRTSAELIQLGRSILRQAPTHLTSQARSRLRNLSQ